MGKQYTFRELQYRDLGSIDYKKAWELQKDLLGKRNSNSIPDTLLLLEHPNTYTLGKTADRNNLIGSGNFLKENKIEVFEIDRGGDVTFHGPGQIVGYPIIDLKNWKQDTHLYLRALEQVIINVCRHFGIECGRSESYTGVWIENRKICAIGIKVSRWITMHGFAFNVNTDLKMYEGIIPCGIEDKEVTSLQKEIGEKVDIGDVKKIIADNFCREFGYEGFKESEYSTKIGTDKIEY